MNRLQQALSGLRSRVGAVLKPAADRLERIAPWADDVARHPVTLGALVVAAIVALFWFTRAPAGGPAGGPTPVEQAAILANHAALGVGARLPNAVAALAWACAAALTVNFVRVFQNRGEQIDAKTRHRNAGYVWAAALVASGLLFGY